MNYFRNILIWTCNESETKWNTFAHTYTHTHIHKHKAPRGSTLAAGSEEH